MKIHENSMKVYYAHLENFGNREQDIMEVLLKAKDPMSDREILQVLKPGSDNMNYVRPRITELHTKGWLQEGPKKQEICGEVRTSRLIDFENRRDKQTRLPLGE